MIDRAPRQKKRLSCELVVNESRYSGIVVDFSASGLFVQMNAKPTPGQRVELAVSLPGLEEPVSMEARVVRKKIVPPQLLTLAGGGVGLAVDEPDEAYLDFVGELSPEHAQAVEKVRARLSRGSGSGGNGAPDGPRARRNGPVTRHFRIHVVEKVSGKKNSFLVSCGSEQEAQDEVLKQLGDDWQVLFIERA